MDGTQQRIERHGGRIGASDAVPSEAGPADAGPAVAIADPALPRRDSRAVTAGSAAPRAAPGEPGREPPLVPFALPTRIAPLANPPRRVMFFGKSKSRSRCTGALVDALRRNGLDVRWRNLSKIRRWFGRRGALARIRSEFERWQPDLVFVFFMDLPEVLLDEFRGRATVVQWIEEAFPCLHPRQIDYTRRVDLACLSDPELLPQLRERGIDHGCFQMSGFSPRYHFPLRGRRPVRDVAFIGGPGADGQRARFLLELADAHTIDVYGQGWEAFRTAHPRLRVHPPIGNRGYRQICADARIVLGMNQFNSDRHYFSNRVWLTLACRGFHLTHHVPGIDDVFDRGVHLDWFRDVDEAVRLVGHYLDDDAARERIAETGWRHAVARHQYLHRVAAVLDLLQGRPPEEPFLRRSGATSGARLGLVRGRAAPD